MDPAYAGVVGAAVGATIAAALAFGRELFLIHTLRKKQKRLSRCTNFMHSR